MWSVITKSTIESKFAEVLQEVELRADRAEAQRQAELAKLKLEELDWQAAIAEAKIAYGDDFRARVLMDHLAR